MSRNEPFAILVSTRMLIGLQTLFRVRPAGLSRRRFLRIAQQLESVVKLSILAFGGRHVGRAAVLLFSRRVSRRPKMPSEASLTAVSGAGRIARSRRGGLFDHDIWFDPLGLDGSAGRGVIPGGGEPQCSATIERDDRLH